MDSLTLYLEYPFAKRLSLLIGLDMTIALVDSFVPQTITVARDAVGLVELAAMAVTMAVALRRVLEDY